MRVDLKAEYTAGVTYRSLRRAFVAVKGYEWSEATVRERLKLDEATFECLIDALQRDGYIEPPERGEPQRWRLSVKGNALAQASGAHPVSRLKAQQELTSFLERVREINDDPDCWYTVTAVYLFGSMLGDHPTVNDIDCFWQLHLAHFGGLIWPTLRC